MKYFPKKLLGHEIFRSIVSWATKYFLKNLQNPSALSPTYSMYAPLMFRSLMLHYLMMHYFRVALVVVALFNFVHCQYFIAKCCTISLLHCINVALVHIALLMLH